MDKTTRATSHLFMMRLWAESVSVGQIEWRGKLQHVLSGEVRYFRDWQTMIAFLEETLQARTTIPDGDTVGGTD